ncbi:MAG: ABC transporter ATP-binding protein [Treponema sp.]|jgi:ABC-2 type transport system ATP-binding protein|nr:ABC transporter ATP-binding protein [Treponema sp.]
MSGLALECRNLSKNYGKFTALDAVNINLNSGRITGLLGPNGSGKTTLIKLVNGLLQPSGGTVTVYGKPIGPESKALVSYLPDRMCLDSSMRVQDAINFYADFYADFSRDVAAAMLRDLNIDPKKRLKALSKGTQEKAQLILVMARKARLYLLDEPIGGVDPAARDYIINTILANYNKEAAVLISTHLIHDVEQVLDDIIFLKEGKVALEGSANDIRTEKSTTIDALFREVFKC